MKNSINNNDFASSCSRVPFLLLFLFSLNSSCPYLKANRSHETLHTLPKQPPSVDGVKWLTAGWNQLARVMAISYIKVNFKISRPTHILSACLPACLPTGSPAVRLTNGKRIGLVFSHNTKYPCANTSLLFWLRFIHCTMVSPFILHCFPFTSTGEQKGEELLEMCWWVLLLILINGKIPMYLIVSSIKIITRRVFVVNWFKSARMVSCWK